MKTCSKCGEAKPLDEFGVDMARHDRKRHMCKPCNRAAAQNWRAHNGGKHRDAARLYGRAHREERIIYAREWRARTPRQCLRGSLRRALARHPTVNPATLDELMAMWRAQDGKCALSRIAMTFNAGRGMEATSLSVDRIDPLGDYSLANLRLVCFSVNAFRGRMNDDELFAMAVALVINLGPQRKTLGKVNAVDFTTMRA